MHNPSTAWREQPLDEEEAMLEGFARDISAIQAKVSARHGPGRTFHRVGIAGLTGRLSVLPDLPPHAAQGVCASPRSYDVRIRLSNGAIVPQSDSLPDIRGFAIKLLGVEGPGALGGDATCQDFLLINRENFGFRDAAPFMAIAKAAAEGPFALLVHMVRTHGFFDGLGRVRTLLADLSAPFGGFLSHPMYSTVPLAWGPYAVRLRLTPKLQPLPKPRRWIDDVRAQLARGPAKFDIEVQYYLDEQRTPIEDASAPWDSPFVPVACLEVPPQELSDTAAAWIEEDRFDPWAALMEHRPLGHIMRARKATYYASQQGRKTT